MYLYIYGRMTNHAPVKLQVFGIHIINIVENRDLRHLLMKGPNYREPCVINWNKVVSCIIAGVTECQKDWARKENVDRAVLNEWSGSLLNLVRNRVNKLKKLNRFRYSSKKSILNKPEIRKYLQELHDRYALFLQIKLLTTLRSFVN